MNESQELSNTDYLGRRSEKFLRIEEIPNGNLGISTNTTRMAASPVRLRRLITSNINLVSGSPLQRVVQARILMRTYN